MIQLMYEPDTSFDAPEPGQHLWRYVDFARCMSLIETQSLYFCRGVRLTDPWEGELCLPLIEELREGLGKDYESEIESIRRTRKEIYLNCWHLNEHQSMAMWKLYTKSDEGIAVLTTFDRLRSCFDPNDRLRRI